MSKSIYKTFSSYKSHILTDDRSKKLKFQPDGRNHYVYRITNFVTSKHYYGSRVTKLEPFKDLGIKYFSSSSDKEFISKQKEYPNHFKYKIIRIFNNRTDMIIFESYLHNTLNVMKYSNFYNKVNSQVFQIGNINYSKMNKGNKNGKFKGYCIFNNVKYGSAIELSKKLNCNKSFINNICKNNELLVNLRVYNNKKILQHFGPKSEIVGKTYKDLGFSFEYVNINRHIKTDGIGINHHSFKGYFIYNNIKYPSATKLSKKIGVTSKTIKNWCINNDNVITYYHRCQSEFLKSVIPINNISKITFNDIGFGYESIAL